MICWKKLWALLLSAALALTLLAGCGHGSRALSQVMADLLSGMYDNVSVETDSDLTAALKKAVAEGGTEEEILTALAENLRLAGNSLTLNQLGAGQQGEHSLSLVFQPGTDPDAAARNALSQWAGAFGSLPDDGSYQASVAMVEAENGYYIAVDAEVTKAGSRKEDGDEPDEDEPDGPVQRSVDLSLQTDWNFFPRFGIGNETPHSTHPAPDPAPDPAPVRCYLQVLSKDGEELPDGLSKVYEAYPDQDQFFSGTFLLPDPDGEYTILAWADNDQDGEKPDTLRNVPYTSDGTIVAFAACLLRYIPSQSHDLAAIVLHHVTNRINVELEDESSSPVQTVSIAPTYTAYDVFTMTPLGEPETFTYTFSPSITPGTSGYFYVLPFTEGSSTEFKVTRENDSTTSLTQNLVANRSITLTDTEPFNP